MHTAHYHSGRAVPRMRAIIRLIHHRHVRRIPAVAATPVQFISCGGSGVATSYAQAHRHLRRQFISGEFLCEVEEGIQRTACCIASPGVFITGFCSSFGQPSRSFECTKAIQCMDWRIDGRQFVSNGLAEKGRVR